MGGGGGGRTPLHTMESAVPLTSFLKKQTRQNPAVRSLPSPPPPPPVLLYKRPSARSLPPRPTLVSATHIHTQKKELDVGGGGVSIDGREIQLILSSPDKNQLEMNY